MADTREYKRPDKLNLLTEEQIDKLHKEDIKREEKENRENDYDYPNQMNRYTRKWYRCMSSAKGVWDKLYEINEKDLYEIIYWLSVPDEPSNPNDNGLNKAKRLARDIKYAMSSKQREVAYRIITERYNNDGKDIQTIKTELKEEYKKPDSKLKEGWENMKPTTNQLFYIKQIELSKIVPIYYGESKLDASRWLDEYKGNKTLKDVSIDKKHLISFLAEKLNTNEDNIEYYDGVIKIKNSKERWFVGTNEQMLKFTHTLLGKAIYDADIFDIVRSPYTGCEYSDSRVKSNIRERLYSTFKTCKDATNFLCGKRQKIIEYKAGVNIYKCSSKIFSMIEDFDGIEKCYC